MSTSITAIAPSGSAIKQIPTGSAVVKEENGKKCQNCGYPIQDDWICCPKCEKKIEHL